MPTSTDLRLLLRHPVDLEVGEDPRHTRFVFATPDGEVRTTADDALGPLSQGIRAMNADDSVRAWAPVAILALRMMARGHLGSPDSAERAQLQEAGRRVDPVDGQRKVQAFLDALAAVAPAVASLPQSTPEPPKPVIREFSGRLIVTFRDEPDDEVVADVRLRVKPRSAGWSEVDSGDLWTRENHHFGSGAKQGVRTLAAHGEQVWAPFMRLLGESGSTGVTLAELGELGTPTSVARLASRHVEIDWPANLRREVGARAVVHADGPAPDRQRVFTSDRLFRFDWQVALGDDLLTAAEVEDLAKAQHGLMKLRDSWVFVDPTRLSRVLDRGNRTLTAAEALRATVGGTVDVDGIRTEVETTGWLDELRLRLAERGETAPVPQPSTLRGELRDYQVAGLRWMAQLVDLGLGGCLADDMGLGKTVMLIALHLHRASLGSTAPTLVVCPASVVGNWEREIRRFAPDVPVVRHHGSGRSVDDVKEGFVVTTYATMRRDAAELRTIDWGLVVADEAQNVKNSRSGAAKAIRTIPAEARLALTGTPVENSLAELWAILDWTTPGLLGTHDEFRRLWSRPIESRHDPRRSRDLAALIRPFVLRRRKSDPGIAPELPPKTETDYRVTLTREQVGLYEATVRATMTEIESSQGIQRRGLIIKLLTQLKQICNHPAHFLRQPGPLEGRSGKFTVLDELIEEILSEDGAVLLFTQYAQFGHLLLRHLTSQGIAAQFLHGGTHLQTREEMVRRFQAGEVPVFVLSLKAAGTGLNLTRADHVIHVDRWWNPAVEDQATDRAHRIGQTKPVQVHRLISAGTIEESIAELIAAKRDLADSVVNAGEQALTELTDAELTSLVRLRR